MANRSYLYSTNVIPGPDAISQGRKLVGISEWNYDIPIVFRLLLSGNPRSCRSSIWETPEEIAILGDYATGVKNLTAFLSQITLPAAQGLITEALDFLSQPVNKSQYFVLECGEIFEMDEEPLLEQNQALLDQIKNLQPEIDRALKNLASSATASPKSKGIFSLFKGRSAPEPTSAQDSLKPIYDLGLGNWSNILYFDFSDENEQE